MSGTLSLATLTPELIPSILSHCSRNDAVSLVRTCKSLYAIVHPHIWSTMYFYPYLLSRLGRPEPWPSGGVNTRSIRSLVQLTEVAGEDRNGNGLGYKYIKNLGLSKAMLSDSLFIQDGVSKMLDILNDKLKSEELRPTSVELTVHASNIETEDAVSSFISHIKRYSLSKLQNEVSVSLDYSCNYLGLSYFDVSKLVSLKLEFPMTLIDSSTSAKLAKDQVTEIEALTTLFNTATRLTYLSISPTPTAWDPEHDYQELEPIPPSEDLLQSLQSALQNLKYLKTLEIADFLFSPSFFPLPPPSVTSLTLSHVHRVSQSWWYTFASSSLPNLRNLTISYFSEATNYRKPWWRGADDGLTEEEDGGFDGLQHWKFYIHKVSFTNLTDFTFEDHKDYLVPMDLVECIVRANEGVKDQWIASWAERYEEDLANECDEKLLQPLQDAVLFEVRDAVKARFVGRFVEEDGEVGDKEEVRRKYIKEYAKEIIGWLEANLEGRVKENEEEWEDE